jgi:DNA topoisomerase-3
MALRILMVAEKPSISQSIAEILSKNQMESRRGILPVHEFQAVFRGKTANFKCTSVAGHVYTTDFDAKYRNWETTDPATLFDAPVLKVESNPKGHVCKHLQLEARGTDVLILWMDCDREGENICFEVIENTKHWMNQGAKIYRARFSAITAPDINKAMQNLGEPNKNEARSVDARQEIDLKVGVAFTRFQTRYFQSKYGNLDSKTISYGPCQTPTLGFCVDRHDEIAQFEPETYWRVVPIVEKGMTKIPLEWARERVFDHQVAHLFAGLVKQDNFAIVTDCTKSRTKTARPVPLNTVALLKVASNNLGIGPHQTMVIAERLYIRGFISYPRTESTQYPEHFNLREALGMQRSHPIWGDYVSGLLAEGKVKAKKGHDAGDHPPITPMACATEEDLGGNDWRLYDYITRHFIASLSTDAKYDKIKIKFSLGGEFFSYSGKRIISEGFTSLMPWMKSKDEVKIDMLEKGDQLPVAAVEVKEEQTSPPPYLSESDLISLMEKHGIGTDASISTHIENIIQRNYVRLEERSRTLHPTHLGVALIHGYHKIDPELVLPKVRSTIEQYISYIAQGKSSFESVVAHTIKVFVSKFDYFVRNIPQMDELFEVSFTTIKDMDLNSKVKPKCGKCKRYMKFIYLKPQRIYCPNCEETYSVPQGGTIKLYKELLCPLDDFELLTFDAPNGQAYSFCPFCYNNPTLEGMEKGLGCNRCTHPTCIHGMTMNTISDCPACDIGKMVLNPHPKPTWRVDCNLCKFSFKLSSQITRLSVSTKECEECGDKKLEIGFPSDKSPLEGGKPEITACLNCHDLISSMVTQDTGTTRLFRGRGGRRGRGRGRKRRGGR